MSDSNKDHTSSLQSAVDTVSGYAQSALGSITGSTADKREGEATKDKASAESDLSHTTARVGPFTTTASGGMAQDNADRTQGQWDQTIGSAKSAVGGLLGSEDLKASGDKQYNSGKGQEAQGILSDYGQGISDRVSGAVGGAYASLTGDKDGQKKFSEQHDDGKARQRGAEVDIQRKGEAEERSSST